MEVHFLAICHQSPILRPVTFQQIPTFCNAFQRFWHNSTLFVYTLSWIFHKSERMCLKVPITDSSTLSLRIAQTLRPLGIIRSMRSYSIIADCLRLIWEQEDRLEAVQKEVYEPIADKQCSDWTAIQSTIRRAAQTAWHTNPSRAGAGWLSVGRLPQCCTVPRNAVQRSCTRLITSACSWRPAFLPAGCGCSPA